MILHAPWRHRAPGHSSSGMHWTSRPAYTRAHQPFPLSTACMSTAQPSTPAPSALLLSSTIMALRRLAEAPQPLPDQRTTDARAQLHRAREQMVHMDPQQLADAVWALGKVSRTRALHSVCRNAQDIAMLWYMAAIGSEPTTTQPTIEQINKIWTGLGATRRRIQSSWSDALQHAMMQRLPACTPHELAGVACAWGATGMAPGGDVLARHGQCVMQLLSDINSQDLAKIMWAWATLSHLPPPVSFAAISDRALGMLDRCTTWELSVMLFAHARFRHAPDDVVGYLLGQRLYQGGLEDLELQAVPGLLTSAAKLGIALPPSRVGECLASVAQQGSSRHVAQCVWAQCVMSAANPEALRAILPRMQAAVRATVCTAQSNGAVPVAAASLLLQSDAAVRCLTGGRQGKVGEVGAALLALGGLLGAADPLQVAQGPSAAAAGLLDEATALACRQALCADPPRARRRVVRARRRLAKAASLLPGVERVAEACVVVGGLFTVDVLCDVVGGGAPSRLAFDIVTPEQCFANVPDQPMGHRVFRSRLVEAAEGVPLLGVPLQELELAEGNLAVVELLQRRMFAAGL